MCGTRFKVNFSELWNVILTRERFEWFVLSCLSCFKDVHQNTAGFGKLLTQQYYSLNCHIKPWCIYSLLVRYACRIKLTITLDPSFIFLIPFQQVDAVLRAATSIVNSGKLKKLFKVILLKICPVLKACCFLLQNETDDVNWLYLTRKSCITPFLSSNVSNTALWCI